MENLLEIINNEVASLEYLKRVQGDSLSWLNVVSGSKNGLLSLSGKEESKQTLNAANYFNLSLSISLVISSTDIKNGNLVNITMLLKGLLSLFKEYEALLPSVETNSTKSKLTGVTAASKRLFLRGKKSLLASSSSPPSFLSSSPTPFSGNPQPSTGYIAPTDDESNTYSLDYGSNNHSSSNTLYSNSLINFGLLSDTSSSYSSASLKRNLSNLRPSMSASSTQSSATTLVNTSSPTGKESGIAVYDTSFIHLKICQLPFFPDLHETFINLCDILIDLFRQVQLTLIRLINDNDDFSSPLQKKENNRKEMSDTFEVLIKIDEKIRKSIIAVTVRDIESLSRTILGKETARLDIKN
ncbi:hypothetical protein NADFUDRAFT_50145 [Nadsonia fulvescens var. elongata DSM 6958]|uniref:Uncharacterized protein n=1 Tax=Nadsonia fulvescens var. elongata DSM 6958 TaxID=857566 RepID=A0A1E3PM08_9ASCO|nr:hypothetical protein NADFUDRAFT_50145 [Nadsonia fulvescens var. elongata DSM 6958]